MSCIVFACAMFLEITVFTMSEEVNPLLLCKQLLINLTNLPEAGRMLIGCDQRKNPF